MSEFDVGLVGLIGVLISSVLFYRFGRHHWLEDRRERRADLATALLVELRYVEGILREMAREDEPLLYAWYAPTPWFDQLFPEIRLFSVKTQVAAYEFFGLVREVKARLEAGYRFEEVTPQDQAVIRGKAYWALHALADLVKALREEGARPLPPKKLEGLDRDEPIPELPPPVFPELEPDRGSYNF